MRTTIIEKTSLFRKSISSSLLVIFQSLIVNIAGILYFMLATHILDMDTVGVLLFSSVIINLMVTLFTFSFNFTSSRFYSLFSSNNLHGKSRLISNIVAIINLISLIVGIPIGFLISYFLMYHTIYEGSVYLISLLIAIDGAINSVIYNCYGLLIGKMNFTKATLGFSIGNIMRYALSGIVIIEGGGLKEILLSWILGDALGASYLYAYSKPTLEPKENISAKELHSIIKYTLPIYLSSILTYFYLYIDRYQVFLLSNIQNFAIYGTALTASMVFINIPQTLSNSLVAVFIRAYSRSYEDMKELIKSVSKFLDITILPIVLVASFFSQPIIVMFAGQSYASGWLYFLIATLSFGFALPTAVLYTYYLTVGETNTILVSNILSIFISTFLALILFYNFSVMGISIGKGILFILNFLILSFFILIKNKVDYGLGFHLKYFLSSLLFFSPLAIFTFNLIHLSRIISSLIAVAYLFLYFFIVINSNAIKEEELNAFSNILPSFFAKLIKTLYLPTKNNLKLNIYINSTNINTNIRSAFYNPDLIRLRFQ